MIVSLPAMVLVAWVECGLGNIDSVYKLKPKLLELQADTIEVLILGSSNAYFDYDPKYFSCPGFNFAINAQSPYYDLKITEKYINDLPNLKLVILPAIFYTLGTNLAETSNSWRTFFYSNYMSISVEKTGLGFFQGLRRAIDPKNFSKIALFGDNTHGYARDKFIGQVDIFIPEKNGWYDSAPIPNLDSKKSGGKDAAYAHSVSVDSRFLDINLQYWQSLINLLKKKGIAVTIIRAPEDQSYFSNLDVAKVSVMNDKIRELASKNHIQFLDYSEDRKFNASDFTVLPDHMNPIGSKKFSEIVNQDLIQKYCLNSLGY
jgi:hypothetical protein